MYHSQVLYCEFCIESIVESLLVARISGIAFFPSLKEQENEKEKQKLFERDIKP